MIGDQLKREPSAPRYPDPEEPLVGRCMTCKTVVGCLRKDARGSGSTSFQGSLAEPGAWKDLLSAECPTCGARVFLMAAKEFERVVSATDESTP